VTKQCALKYPRFVPSAFAVRVERILDQFAFLDHGTLASGQRVHRASNPNVIACWRVQAAETAAVARAKTGKRLSPSPALDEHAAVPLNAGGQI
jgi:hypothetical protein